MHAAAVGADLMNEMEEDVCTLGWVSLWCGRGWWQ